MFKYGLIMYNIVFKRAYRATHRADRATLFRAVPGRAHGLIVRPRHDPFKHENINGSCRACPWAEVPAQA